MLKQWYNLLNVIENQYQLMGVIGMRLDLLEKYRKCIIEEIPGVALLNALGIRKGVTVSIVTKQPFGGPIIVEIANRSFAIACDIAKDIRVREVS